MTELKVFKRDALLFELIRVSSINACLLTLDRILENKPFGLTIDRDTSVPTENPGEHVHGFISSPCKIDRQHQATKPPPPKSLCHRQRLLPSTPTRAHMDFNSYRTLGNWFHNSYNTKLVLIQSFSKYPRLRAILVVLITDEVVYGPCNWATCKINASSSTHV